ncbi:MAG: hypothetical protein K8L97_08250 [Anaerolineae bacterium]|nr:hypothetical protein [Anaerolineae bacterium]
MRFRVWGVCALVLLLIAPLAGRIQAAGVVGIGTPESCTQEALQNVLNSGGLVTFDCGGAHTIAITSPRMISVTTTIDGAGLITLDGGGVSIILQAQSDVPLLTLQNLRLINAFNNNPNQQINGAAVSTYYRTNVTVINCTFENNITDSTFVNTNRNLDFGGGAIYVHTGTLTVQNSVFTDNQSIDGAGGALHVLHGNVVIEDTTFENNQATGYGGAFYNDGVLNPSGFLVFRRTTFIGNSGNGQGGAVFAYLYAREPNTTTTIEDSRFIDNSLGMDAVNHSFGGALRLGSGRVLVKNTVFSGNTAVRQGGAIWSGEAAAIVLDNVTISDNHATDPNVGYGGAIKVSNSRGFTINNSTIAYNTAGEVSGGLFDSPATLRNTIVVFNTASNNSNGSQNCNRTYASGGGNIQSALLGPKDVRCAAGITFADPLLLPLANNGGLTETHALPANSPAVDRGVNLYCSEKDQRGIFRPFDGNWDGSNLCDSGAYELRDFNLPNAIGAAPYRNAFDVSSPTLSWGRFVDATGYALEIDNNSDFSSVNFRYENLAADANEFLVPDVLPGGVWYWRVQAKNPNGTWGGWSVPDSFLILVP